MSVVTCPSCLCTVAGVTMLENTLLLIKNHRLTPLTQCSIFLQGHFLAWNHPCLSKFIDILFPLSHLTLSVSGIVFYLPCSLSLISSQIAAGVQSHAVNTNYYQRDPKLGHSTRCHVKNMKHTHAGKRVSVHSKAAFLQTCWHRHISSCLLLWMSVQRHAAFVLCVKHTLCVLSCLWTWYTMCVFSSAWCQCAATICPGFL